MACSDANGSRFQSHRYFQKRWDSVGRKLAFSAKTVDGCRAWHRKTVGKLKELTGFDTMLTVPLRPRITEEKRFKGYIRQRVEIQTEPGIVMPMYVLIPRATPPPYPAVIAPHGHASAGKLAVVNCRRNQPLRETIDKHNYAYGVQFAEAGFITFCPDARGFGERKEKTSIERREPFLTGSCRWLNNMAYPLGQTVTGMWAWDIHRLVDYVLARDDCRHDGVGCAGLSGGGLQTLWATVFDTRITCAVVSGYFYGYKESLLDKHGNCACNYVPHLYEYVDMGDIGALVAPRPLLIETGTRDGLNGASGLRNVRSQVRITRAAYRLFGEERCLKHDVFEGEHRWHGKHAVPWMKRFLSSE